MYKVWDDNGQLGEHADKDSALGTARDAETGALDGTKHVNVYVEDEDGNAFDSYGKPA